MKREILRALIAFGIYLILYPLWTSSGAAAAYESAIARAAAAFDAMVSHFPRLSAPAVVPFGFFDFLILLDLACAVASHGMSPRRRILRAGLLVVAIVVAHVVALTIQNRVWLADNLWRSDGIMLLLPRERQAAVWIKYMLYEFGLQIAPFVLVGLWVRWNLLEHGRATSVVAQGEEAGAQYLRDARQDRAGRWRRMAFIGPALVLVALLPACGWSAIRERDPRHIKAHVWFAEHFLRDRQWPAAEGQYRAAIDGGCRDWKVFYNLSLLRKRQRDIPGASALLRRGLEATTDPAAQEILRGALEKSPREPESAPDPD